MRTATSTVGLLAMAIGVAALFLIGLPAPVASQAEKYRVGVVTLLAGPFAASIGVPAKNGAEMVAEAINNGTLPAPYATKGDRKSTRLNSSHGYISYAVFCLKKKKNSNGKDT